MSTFLREGWVTIRTPRACVSCGVALGVGARALVNVSVDGGQAYSATLCPTCGEHFQTCGYCREEEGMWSDLAECMRVQALDAEEAKP